MYKTTNIKLKQSVIGGISNDGSICVGLRQSTKLLPFGDVSESISQREVFDSEREGCNCYRLITTITPYCTNVLFNVLTEVVKNEGSDTKVYVVTDEDDGASGYQKANSRSIPSAAVISSIKTPTRIEMIRNTEYSKDSVGYEYLPGYDIFNNHILRNKTFKLVNRASSPDYRFNTIEDDMRNFSGSNVILKKRISRDADVKTINKHLYDVKDILPYVDSINANLVEENGWFGFINTSTVGAKGITNVDWNKDLDISRVINNRSGCDFIDMYPDRTLYSFVPKYNKFRHRPEYNWHLCVTYPYKNDKNHPLVANIDDDGNFTVNALAVLECKYTETYLAKEALYFRTYIRHGLTRGDYVYVYYSFDKGKTYRKSEIAYKVDGVGDLDKNNEDYYFYIGDSKIIDEIMEVSGGYSSGYSDGVDSGSSFTNISAWVEMFDFRFTRCVNGIESEYYFRRFRKLPNFRFKNENLTTEVGADKGEFDLYINNNARNTSAVLGDSRYRKLMNKPTATGISEYVVNQLSSSGKIIEFNSEQYKLSFANTIYGDEVAQATFTDSIDIENIVDNLGRPISEIYLTIIKNNAGYSLWYDKSVNARRENPLVEYSHCFGRITSGLEMLSIPKDNDEIKIKRAKMSDVAILNNLNVYRAESLGSIMDINTFSLSGQSTKKENIFRTNDEFIGDVVEFIPCEYRERVLSDVMFRFNTAQREQLDVVDGQDDDCIYKCFRYEEIEYDDYDYYTENEGGDPVNSFKIDVKTVNKISMGGEPLPTFLRPEGYYYKPHYKISLRDFGQVIQGSHNTLKVSFVKPVQRNGIFIEVKCAMPSSVSIGDNILVCDDNTDNQYRTNVVDVVDEYTFIMKPLDEMGWVKFCDIMNADKPSKRYVLRRVNTEIPSYAYRVSSNRYLWRNIRPNGDSDSNVPEYTFANGHFYINQSIDFFLKRQDPYNYNGLQAKEMFPNDIFGVTKAEVNSEYKDETETSKC